MPRAVDAGQATPDKSAEVARSVVRPLSTVLVVSVLGPMFAVLSQGPSTERK